MTVKEMNALQVGDIIRRDRGGRTSIRIVRRVSRQEVPRYGTRVIVEFVKQTRSRFRSPTTLVHPRELLSRQYVATGHRKRLTSRLDRLIARHVASWIGDKDWCCVTQDDVVGVIS